MDTIIHVPVQIVNCYLVKGDHCYMVDAAVPKGRKRIDRALQESGIKPQDLTHILVTHYHFDHVGSLAYYKRLSGAKVAAGAEDVPYIQGGKPPEITSDLNRVGRFLRKMPKLQQSYQKFETVEVDIPLVGGEVLEELGLEVIALPGHTPGGIGFLDRGNKYAFVGDMVANYFGRIGPPTISASYSLELIEASMRRLAEMDLEYMYPGHGKVIGPHASEKVADYVKKKFG